MQLQTVDIDGKTYALVSDGKPVFKDDAGKEIAFDAPATVATIGRLNGEAKGHRERAEAAEKTAKAFEGIDPAAARKALDTVKGMDEKSLIAAGDRDAAIAAAVKAKDEEYAPVKAKAETLEAQLNAELIGGGFARSKFGADKLAIPADIAQARFEKHFKIEDGKPVAYDSHGNKIFSKARPGEPADFDEAYEFLVDTYPNKNSILKGTGAAGSGARGSEGGGSGGKTISRGEFAKLAPAEQLSKTTTEGFTVTE